MSEPTTTTAEGPGQVEISDDPREFLTGPEHGEASKTEGGTTRAGNVAAGEAARVSRG